MYIGGIMNKPKPKSIIQNSYIIVVGKTFDMRKALDAHGFKFIYDQKAHYKLASKETLDFWKKAIENENAPGLISVAHVESLSDIKKINDLHKESLALMREFDPKVIEQDNAPIESAFTGKILEVSKWYAGAFAENNGVEIAFRNMLVVAVYKETAKAILADVEFFAGVSFSCGICGLKLTNKISQATGIGPVCAEKWGLPRVSEVNAADIVKAINEKCAKYGTFKGVWIPRSQIKNVVDKETKKPIDNK